MGLAEKQKMSCTFATAEVRNTLSTPKTLASDQTSGIISMSIQSLNISNFSLLGANPVVERLRGKLERQGLSLPRRCKLWVWKRHGKSHCHIVCE